MYIWLDVCISANQYLHWYILHVYLTWCLYFCQPIFALVYFTWVFDLMFVFLPTNICVGIFYMYIWLDVCISANRYLHWYIFHVYLTWCFYFCQPIFALVYFRLSGFLLKICAIIPKGGTHIYQTDTKWFVNIGRQCPTRGRGQTWIRREIFRHIVWLSLQCPLNKQHPKIPTRV